MDPQKLIWIDTQGSVTHIAVIFKFGDVSGPRGKKVTQSKSQIKGSKGSIGGYPPHIYHHIFWQYVGPIFSWEKINEYFSYHPEIFLGVFYDNLC